MDRTDLKWSPLTPLTETEIKKLGRTAGAFRISEKSSDGRFYVIFVGSSADIEAELLKIISPSYEQSSFKSYLSSGKEFAFLG